MKTADQVKPNFAPVYAAAFYPDMARLCVDNGYALTVHGSMARDMDLLAVPWTPEAVAPDVLLDLILKKFDLTVAHQPDKPRGTAKPHGRTAYTLIGDWGHWFIDLGIMPLHPVSADKAATPET